MDRHAATKQCILALEQWYETMIPALFPMMLLSNILVDTGFASKIGKLCNRTIFRVLKISNNGCYCMLTGFFFGFPMGAKTVVDMRKQMQISEKEAEYLLTFINCIGPMYTINLIHTLFPQQSLWKLLAGIYILPLFYGIFLRYTIYRKDYYQSTKYSQPLHEEVSCVIEYKSFSDALYECVPKCGKSILILGGYMILFQISFVTLQHILVSVNLVTNVFYPLLEITGGLFKLPYDTSLSAILFYTNFGGGCCMMQTYSFLKSAGIPIKKYILHKTVLSILAFLIGHIL